MNFNMYSKCLIKRRVFLRYKVSQRYFNCRMFRLLNNVNNDYKKSIRIIKKKNKDIFRMRERHRLCLKILEQDTSSKISKKEQDQLIHWHQKEFQEQSLYLEELHDLMFTAKKRLSEKHVTFPESLMEEDYNKIFDDFATFQKQMQKFITLNQKNNLPTFDISLLGKEYASEV